MTIIKCLSYLHAKTVGGCTCFDYSKQEHLTISRTADSFSSTILIHLEFIKPTLRCLKSSIRRFNLGFFKRRLFFHRLRDNLEVLCSGYGLQSIMLMRHRFFSIAGSRIIFAVRLKILYLVLCFLDGSNSWLIEIKRTWYGCRRLAKAETFHLQGQNDFFPVGTYFALL